MIYLFYVLGLTWFVSMFVQSTLYWSLYYDVEAWWWGVCKLFNL